MPIPFLGPITYFAYDFGKWLYKKWYYKKAQKEPPAPDKPEVIGVQSPTIFSWNVDSKDPTNWTLATDTTSRPGHIKIALDNDTGAADILLGFAIKGAPVKRMSGDAGFKHDAHNDYDDIIKNGERAFTFGNNWVCTKNQLEQLADYYWKVMRDKKHLYVIQLSGTRFWYEPGEWYTLQVGGAGQVEYIDATVECYDVQTERRADGTGTTIVAFREVEQNWVFDSNASARFIACGSPYGIPGTEGVMTVASQYYTGTADYYCDGTSDETEINQAIDAVSDRYGAGEIRLLGDTFETDGEIQLKSGIVFNLNGCTINRNSSTATDVAIEINPASGTHTNIIIEKGTVQADSSDSSTAPLIYMTDVNNIAIRDMTLLNGTGRGIHLYSETESASNISIERCTIKDCVNSGIRIRPDAYNAAFIRVVNCTISGCEYGIYTWYATVTISNNHITDCSKGGVFLYETDNSTVSSNFITESGYYRETAARCGIYVYTNSDDNLISGNMAKTNGNLINNQECEHATDEPQLDGNVLTSVTAARSSVQAHGGTYSYLITKTVASGTGAQFEMTDNTLTTDQHGLQDSYIYRLGMWIYIPTSGGPSASEVTLYISDYQGSWEHSTQAAAATYDAWQYVEVTRTIRASATGCLVRVYISSTAEDTEYFYIDDVRLTSMTLSNTAHTNQFIDSGTGTVTSGNSWQ